MREILFRGKRTDNGEWVYGYYVCDETGQISEEPIAFIYHLNNHPCGWDLIPFEVIPETVGQFTGLTDKNGTKIFEHDIVRCEFNSAPPMNGKVVFENGAFGLRWKHHGSGVENFAAFECICNVEYTVIGNIHDNPELLEEEEVQNG